MPEMSRIKRDKSVNVDGEIQFITIEFYGGKKSKMRGN